MTTIAFKDGVMAGDTRVTADSEVVATCRKVFKTSAGAVLGTAGDLCDEAGRALFDTVSSAKDFPSLDDLRDLQIEIDYLIALPCGELWRAVTQKRSKRWLAELFQVHGGVAAIGTGSAYALGAMAAGATAKGAVRIAARWDTRTSEPILSLTAPSPCKTRP